MLRLKELFRKLVNVWTVGVDWFDATALVTFLSLSLILFCIAITTVVVWAVKLISLVPIIGLVLVVLVVLLFLRAFYHLWMELYDNDLLSIKNLILAHIGSGVAATGELFIKLFKKA